MLLKNKTSRGFNAFNTAMQTGVSRRISGRQLSGVGMRGLFDDLTGYLEQFGTQTIEGAVHDWTGAGAFDVDIVPYQNAVFNGVIVPISNIVNASTASQLSTQELNLLLRILQGEQQRWLNFASNYPWKTVQERNRAAAGVQTLSPYWSLYQQRIEALIPNSSSDYVDAIMGASAPAGLVSPVYPGEAPGSGYVGTGTITGGTGGLPGGGGVHTTAGFSTPTAVILGILALMIFSRKRGRT